MGFFGRKKQLFEMAKTGIKLGLEEQRNMPTTAEGMDARMNAMIAEQEAGLAYAERVARLNAAGVPTPATIVSATISQPPYCTLVWNVEPVGGSPYQAQSVDAVARAADVLVPGARCVVLVDPADPQVVMAINWGPGAAKQLAELAAAGPPAPAAPPASGNDTLDRIEKLADLKAKGLITDDEFAVRKARIIGS